jgi:hypothetical protein
MSSVLAMGLVSPSGSAGSAATIAFVPVPAAAFSVAPAVGKSADDALVLWGTGEATATLDLAERTARLEFSAQADPCAGLPELHVRVDDVSVFDSEIAGTGKYAVRGLWAPGRHLLTFGFGNDRTSENCDRNISVRSVGMWTNGAGGPTSYVEQHLDLAAVAFNPAGAGLGTASAARLHANGSFTGPLDSHAAKRFTVRFTARACAGPPRFRLSIDDVVITEQPVPASVANGASGRERTFTINRFWVDGVHKVKISFVNDLRAAGCNRSLAVVSAYFSGTV